MKSKFINWRTSWKGNSFAVHDFNIHLLAVEMFKVSHNMVPTIIDNFITRQLQSSLKIYVRNVRNGQNSIQYYGSLI